MEISVFTTRESIFGRVRRRMEWEGTRSPLGEDDYGRVSVSEADRCLFHSFFDEAAMYVIDLCRPFLSSVANTDDALSLHITLPDDAEDTGLSMAVGNMMASHVLAQWQEIVSPARAEGSFSRRDDYAGKVLAILYHHKAPRRAAAAISDI